ncbi:hypothetical protein SHIRM173S_03909 [Streptomyces hirsutus]
MRLKAGGALSALSVPFPGLKVEVPASELRNQPVVSRNDLFELPVRLNGRLAWECATGRSVADTAAHEARVASCLSRDAERGNVSLDG